MKKSKPVQDVLWQLMKLTLLQMAIAVLFTSVMYAADLMGQEVLDRKVSIAVENQQIKDVLEKIEKIASVSFTYRTGQIKVDKKISLELKDMPLRDVLNSIFGGSAEFEIAGEDIFIKPSDQSGDVLFNDLAPEQPESNNPAFVVTGSVSDDTGSPLPGVNIIEKGTTNGTTSDANGQYKINVADGNATLVFSFIGYASQEMQVNNQMAINVSLVTDVQSLSEVVVIGYGARSKAEVSGAVTQVDSKTFTRQPITSFDQGLVGQVPGMSIREGTGSPGAGPEILIRGINSLGNNAPLIVVDGFIFGNYNNQSNNLLSLFNPEDIESVSVLKDAESKAIYGSRASNGVILITTKAGKKGSAKISLSASVGIQNPMPFEDPNVMNTRELAQFNKERITDNIRRQQPATYGDPSVPVPDNLIPVQYRNPEQYDEGTNWYKEITRQSAIQTYNLAISGGTDNVQYHISGNFLDNQGVILNTGFQRYSFRSNIDFKLNKKWRGGFNINPSRTTRQNPFLEPGSGQFSAYSTLTSTYWISPNAKVRDEFGNFIYTTQDVLTTSYTRNPVYALNAFERNHNTFNNLLAGFLEFEPLKDLLFKSTFTYQGNFQDSRTFTPSKFVDDSLTPVFPRVTGASASASYEKWESLLSETTVSYRFSVNKHRINLLGGWTVQDSYIQNADLNSVRLLDEGFKLPASGNTDPSKVGNFTGSEGYTDVRFLGVLSRLNYVYNDKYIFNFSLRRDASSRFGPDNRWATFPALSGAWRISKEKFFEKIPAISELRIEGGYGISGNAASVENYSFQGDVNNANYLFGGKQALGYSLAKLPNEALTWEEQRQWDLGVKIGLLRDRLSFSLNFYKQVTEGALVDVGVPNVVGYGAITGNQGSIENKGFEFDLTAIPVSSQGIAWTTTLNVSRYENKILSLVNDAPFFGAYAGNGTPVIVSRVGQSIGMIQGLKIIGRYTEEDMANTAVPKYTNAAVGGYRFEDHSGDGVIQLGLTDYVDLANPHPDLLFGWTNQFTYKKFSLRTVMSGQLGGAIMDLRREILFNVDGNFNVSREMLNRYRPGDVVDETKSPGTWGNTQAIRFPSSASVFSATQIGLRNLTFGYNFTSLANSRRKLVENLDLFFSARNVFFIAAYENGNPEVRRAADGSANRSINYGSYPIACTLTLGINVTF
jgi:TonB-dependent starch-binding outer membrane protein SusC